MSSLIDSSREEPLVCRECDGQLIHSHRENLVRTIALIHQNHLDAGGATTMKVQTWQDRFSAEFYKLWKAEGLGPSDDGFGTARPWGMPWVRGAYYKQGCGPRESARDYFESNLTRIKSALGGDE